jgi:hypothetical protein
MYLGNALSLKPFAGVFLRTGRVGQAAFDFTSTGGSGKREGNQLRAKPTYV